WWPQATTRMDAAQSKRGNRGPPSSRSSGWTTRRVEGWPRRFLHTFAAAGRLCRIPPVWCPIPVRLRSPDSSRRASMVAYILTRRRAAPQLRVAAEAGGNADGAEGLADDVPRDARTGEGRHTHAQGDGRLQS